jgi:hypothetical protein
MEKPINEFKTLVWKYFVKLSLRRSGRRSEHSINVVGFEVLTAVVMENFIFWDTTPCSLLKLNGVSVEHNA